MTSFPAFLCGEWEASIPLWDTVASVSFLLCTNLLIVIVTNRIEIDPAAVNTSHGGGHVRVLTAGLSRAMHAFMHSCVLSLRRQKSLACICWLLGCPLLAEKTPTPVD
eukprot:TRINITY_DN28823_c0_g1_i1.p1 TRINITY_DN28823_c0_g1~~TRINITY_DN28823_c0_g1_i1.p1  ORF type:complete len:108 (+),score=1.29 TRINITY_DN28823_c0_g1_i1:669-992(+)